MLQLLFHYKFKLWTPEGFVFYFCTILVGAVSCSLVLRWATNDSYDLPSFKNKKRLHFGANLSDAGATSFYRVRETLKKKKGK